ncbi:MAG: helix-turn-helix domain-containing protein [Steroidobacteraceae bacterium]
MSEAAVSPGARLKAAREQRGLSAQKAADEMHLDRWVIDALEADDYKRIGPTVYAKGHLKKYAALLGLPAEEILAGYESRSHSGGEAVLSGAGMRHAPRADAPQARHLKPLPMALSVAAVLLLVGVLWWRPWHQRGPLRSVPQVAAAISSSPVNELPDKAVGATGISEAAPAPVAAPSAPASAAAPAPAAATPAVVDAAVPGAGRARLRLSFSADSWVDVHDASGHRTFAGTGLANSVKTIAGAAPMRVYLGFGSGVQLEINDRVVAIGPQFFAGDVARFEAGADGVLRRDSHAEQSRGDPSRGDPAHAVQAASARPTG